MNRDTTKTGVKLSIWIITLSVIGLALISLLPWISIEESNYVEDKLDFNFEMMKNSDNVQITSYADDLQFINILFWIMLIFGLVSFIFIMYHIFSESSYLGHIVLTAIGLGALIVSILIVYFHYVFITNVEQLETITLSTIFYSMKYAHIPLIFAVVLLICAVFFAAHIIFHSIKQIRGSKRKEKSDKKSKETSKKEDTPAEIKFYKERVEMEDWLKGQAQDMKKQTVKEESKEIVEPFPQKETKEIIITDVEHQEEPFPPEKSKEEPETTDELKVSQSFEDALSSAIKKQGEIKKKSPLESEAKSTEQLEPAIQTKEKIEIPPKKEDAKPTGIIVRCPQCKNMFSVKKEGPTTKIKCPNCGKEGVAK